MSQAFSKHIKKTKQEVLDDLLNSGFFGKEVPATYFGQLSMRASMNRKVLKR